MKIEEPGYYWYKPNGNLNQIVVKVEKGFISNDFIVWFFGSEIEMSLPAAEYRGTFLKKVNDYAN